MHAAYFDRIANDHQAVLLVESIRKDFLVPISKLPQGSAPGSWFLVEIQEEKITSIKLDEEKTKEMEDEIHNRMTRLQSKKRSRFKKR